MKKLFLLVPLLASLFIACENDSTTDKGKTGNTEQKLLKSITIYGGEKPEYITDCNFVYDNQDRLIQQTITKKDLDIIKKWGITISYPTDKKIVVVFDNPQEGGKAETGSAATTATITLDDKGYATSCLYKHDDNDQSLANYTYTDGHINEIIYGNEAKSFVWKDGNKIQYEGSRYDDTFEYNDIENDAKLNFLDTFTDEAPEMIGLKGWTNKNYLTKISNSDGDSKSLSYEFDNDGYPTKITPKYTGGFGGPDKMVLSYY